MIEREIELEQLEQEELLAGFKGEGISVEQIGRHLYRSGLLVKLVIGRIRLKYSVDPKALGVDFSDLASGEFARDHLENGKISMLPIVVEKRLNSLEGALRNRQKRLAVGFDGQFLPLDSYSEFKKDFENTRKEYFAVRDDIVALWDTYVSAYKEKLRDLLSELNAIERGVVYDRMIANIPTAKEYQDSFKMLMVVKTMPQVEEDSGLHDEINQILAKDIVSVVFETIAGCLDKVVKLANSAIRGNEDGDIPPRTIGAIRTLPVTLRTRNVVANNPMVEELAELIHQASQASEQSELATTMEIVESLAYCYATDNNIPLSVKPTMKESSMRKLNNLMRS